MQDNEKKTKIEKTNSFVEKWALILIVLTVYLFMSFVIIKMVSVPPDRKNPCGNGQFAGLIFHFLLALTAVPILAFKLFNNKKFSLLVSIIILAIVIILPFISYSYY